MEYKIRDMKSGLILMDRVTVADNFFKRLIGLMGKPYIPVGEGLLLKNVKAVHTCFMRFPIQVIYLDQYYRVIAKEVLSPWKCGRLYKKACHVLETGIYNAAVIHTDMRLCLVDKEED